MEKATPNDLLQIGSGFRNCLSLWREIKGICQGRTSLDNIIRDMSNSLEATLQSGVTSAEQSFQIIPRDKRAFDYGDGTILPICFYQDCSFLMCGIDTSHKELNSVVTKQRLLVTDLENIRGQLTFYFQQQQASPTQRSARNTVRKPESILDIHTMVTITESVFDHINSTSAALINLAQRIEAKDNARLSPNKASPSSSSSKSSSSMHYPPSPQPSFASKSPPSVYESPKMRNPEKSVPASEFEFTVNPPLPARPQHPPPAYESPRPKVPERPPTPAPTEWTPEPSLPTRHPDPPAITRTKPQRPSETPLSTNDATTPPPLGLISNKPGTYCSGALRLQQNPTLRINDILLKDSLHTTSTQPVCKYCNLELDIYPWDIKSMAERWQDCTEAASQHILMCASLVDRKAMFRCLACERRKHVNAEFRSAREFVDHRRTH
jgi:hypothetical protein